MTTAIDHEGDPPIEVRHRLRIAREHAGLDQGQLARRMGVTRTTVSNAENGKGTPQRTTLTLWALACGVRLRWLETGNPPDGDPDPTSGLRIIRPDCWAIRSEEPFLDRASNDG